MEVLIMGVNSEKKSIFEALYHAISNQSTDKIDTDKIDGLLGKFDGQLPELFMKAAENTGASEVADLVLSHWMKHDGFDEVFESPLMTMIKKGHILAAANVAYTLTKVDEHDFTDTDNYGMTVIDWAEIMNAEDLRSYLEERFAELRAINKGS